MQCDRYIGLVRVSTERQGESRLGLEAGHADLQRYVLQQGATLLTTLEEVESGGSELIDRPTLLKALAMCRRRKACLLVPKVDRLVRSTEVHTDIKRSGVPFRAVDNPEANELTLDVLVAVAAQERRAISDRTKKALEAYKANKHVSKRIKLLYGGNVPQDVIDATAGKLGADLVGSPLTDEARALGRAKGNAKQARKAVEMYEDLIPDMQRWQSEGMSLRAIAAKLNEEGHTTRNGRGVDSNPGEALP